MKPRRLGSKRQSCLVDYIDGMGVDLCEHTHRLHSVGTESINHRANTSLWFRFSVNAVYHTLSDRRRRRKLSRREPMSKPVVIEIANYLLR